MADGRYDVRFRLFDAQKQQGTRRHVAADESGAEPPGRPPHRRLQTKLTQPAGFFSTRIAYVVIKSGVSGLRSPTPTA